ncbi:hypothetical protein MRX96_010425 [Rhipicephalus microplus]
MFRQPALCDSDDDTWIGVTFKARCCSHLRTMRTKVGDYHRLKKAGHEHVKRGYSASPCLGVPHGPNRQRVSSLTPQTLEQLLERQWDQGPGFMMRHTQNFDISSLMSRLHQLRLENMELESQISDLEARRDQLLAVNAQLMGPFREAPMPNSHMPLVSHASA